MKYLIALLMTYLFLSGSALAAGGTTSGGDEPFGFTLSCTPVSTAGQPAASLKMTLHDTSVNGTARLEVRASSSSITNYDVESHLMHVGGEFVERYENDAFMIDVYLQRQPGSAYEARVQAAALALNNAKFVCAAAP